MNLKLVLVAVLVLGVLSVSACTPEPTPTPTPAPTATTVPTATRVPPTLVPTAIPTMTSTATATRIPATPTATATITLTPTPNPRDALVNAMTSAVQKTKSYSVRIVEEGRNIAVVLPDRFYQFESDVLIKIGGTVYFYDFSGKLMGRNQPTPFFDRVNLHLLRDQVIQVKQATTLPPTAIDGVQCVGYQTTFVQTLVQPAKTPGATPQSTQVNQPVKVWFSTKDGSVKQINLGEPNARTLIFADFNEDFVINPPQ